MTEREKREAVIRYWLDKSADALESARMETDAGRFSFAVNRAYYACFYAVSALLLKHGSRFKKHSGVRAEFHREFVKTGALPVELGKYYDLVYSKREQGDYAELVSFEKDEVEELLARAAAFVDAISGMLSK